MLGIGWVGLLAVGLAVFGTALWLGRPPKRLNALFGLGDCARIDVTVPGRGAVEGIEDLALLPDGRLLLSAYSRRGTPDRPEGLFLARLDDIVPGEPLTAEPLAGAGAGLARLRPHGLAVAPGGRRIAFINRPDDGRAEVVWGVLEHDRFVRQGVVHSDDYCRANNLAFAEDTLYVTIDRRYCGGSIADLMPYNPTATVLRLDLSTGTFERLDQRFDFANGIAVVPEGVAVAETRASRISFIGTDRRITLPGGPDNLSLSEDGRLVSGLHPDLIRYGLYRGGYAGSAPTRIVAADPATSAVTVLVDDPSGDIFSGASAAILTGNRLVAGSPIDRGLLFCRKKP